MNFGILGTGMVGHTIGTALVALGHEVMMGARQAGNPKAAEWARRSGALAKEGSFSDAAAFGEVIFNCTAGSASLEALRMAGGHNLSGKVLIDVANPLDFSRGMPPSLIPSCSNTTSLGEEIQRAFPDARVVKTLNTMNCHLMVNASLVAGDHDVFLCGNDALAKEKTVEILGWFGWQNPIDLGDLSAARCTEMMLPLWVRLFGIFGSPQFNFKIVR